MIFLNRNIKYFFLLILLLNIFSCNIFRKNINNTISIKENKINKITEKVNSNTLLFETFTAGFSGNYEDNKQKLPLKGIIKIQKNKFIWITIRPFLGIEVARILLTTDSVKFINKINNQYFTEGYNYLQKKYGFTLDYFMIEKLFTNRIFTYPGNEKIINYILAENQNEFIFTNEYSENVKTFIHTLILNKNFNLEKNRLALSDSSKSAEFNYTNFTLINSKFFPQKISIRLKNNNAPGKVNIDLKNIIIDSNLSAKFNIPKNYKRIYFD